MNITLPAHELSQKPASKTEGIKATIGKKKIYLTVTTDLSYDQRMIRICTSLANAGYEVILVGRKLRQSVLLIYQPFQQHRINCLFEKGKLFYAEYNARLFFYLLSKKPDCIVSIDLDTILPGLWISQLKQITRVYDAHELFCEMKEIVSRPSIYKWWKKLERYAVPRFSQGYTVNQPIADKFREMYGVNYSVIRNMALLHDINPEPCKECFILYQGAVNEGRCFETLIPAMISVNSTLLICGDGNFMQQAVQLVNEYQLQDKVIFKGKLDPVELRELTKTARIGITLFDDTGLSNYFSLANRFFDYMQAGIPQLCIDYPVYREVNDEYHIALLIKEVSAGNIALQLNKLLNDQVMYDKLRQNCLHARQVLNWQEEEKKLLAFYRKVFLE